MVVFAVSTFCCNIFPLIRLTVHHSDNSHCLVKAIVYGTVTSQNPLIAFVSSINFLSEYTLFKLKRNTATFYIETMHCSWTIFIHTFTQQHQSIRLVFDRIHEWGVPYGDLSICQGRAVHTSKEADSYPSGLPLHKHHLQKDLFTKS